MNSGLISIGGTVLSVFLLLFVGYGVKKLRILNASNCDVLNTVVIYVMLPAYIFNAIYGYRETVEASTVYAILIGFVMIALVSLLSYLIGRLLRFDNSILAGLILAAAFGNTGFLGFPVVEAAFKDRGAALFTAVLYDEFAMALPLYTVGIIVATGFMGEKFDPDRIKRLVYLPQLWAIPVALLIRPFALPEPLLVALKYLANGTVPLVMISIGLSLSARSMKGYALPVIIACAMKLAVLPFFTYYAAQRACISGISLQTITLEAGMPTAMMAGVLIAKFGRSGQFVASTIFISTMLSLITIPVILMLVTR
ncbi:MAG: AEC family transporter [Armatimonadota bacterium]